jgi:colanic acid/amylovoran biosynthesis glycosyltransferase
MPQPKIGLVLSSVPAYSETFFTNKINGLAEKGFNMVVFARGRRQAGLRCRVVNPYPVPENMLLRIFWMALVLPFTLLRAPRPCVQLWKMEKEEGEGTVNVLKCLYLNAHILPHNLHWLHFGFATMSLGRENVARAIGAKMAVSLRGYDIHVYPLKHPGCYGRLWNKVNKVHSISHHLLDRARELGLAENVPRHVITPAVNTQLPVRVNSEFHTPLQVLTVSRLTWIKGLNYALQAIALLKAQGLDIHYTITGEGQEREHLLHEIHELNLDNQVTLKGKRSHSETLASMQKADIYLQPSLNEGFCNAVLEAQAMGLLCVVSDAGALRENVINQITGWTVPARNSSRLAEKIMEVLRLSDKEKEKIRRQAADRVKNNFSIDRHINEWMIFYEAN